MDLIDRTGAALCVARSIHPTAAAVAERCIEQAPLKVPQVPGPMFKKVLGPRSQLKKGRNPRSQDPKVEKKGSGPRSQPILQLKKGFGPRSQLKKGHNPRSQDSKRVRPPGPKMRWGTLRGACIRETLAYGEVKCTCSPKAFGLKALEGSLDYT